MSPYLIDMKRLILFIAVLCVGVAVYAGTPAEDLIERFESLKGARGITVSGAKMVFARPVIRRFPIGPLADDVKVVSVLKMNKVSESDRQRFLESLGETLDRNYEYYGKADTPNGIVDVYVHLKNSDIVDELVIYNPELCVLNSLLGSFPVSALLALNAGKNKAD